MTRTMNSKMNKTMTAACAGAAFCCACAASNTVILSVLGAIIMASIICIPKTTRWASGSKEAAADEEK